MLKLNKYFALVLLIAIFFSFSVEAAKSQIKGDPELLWLSPLGDEDIENTPYNRCRIIRKIKPGMNNVSETTQNNYDIFSNYVSNLYAQSVKITSYIAEEKDEKTTDSATSDLSNEIALIEEGITKTTLDISRRMNIIVSFEAGIAILNSLEALQSLEPGAYEDFRALQNGKYEYVSDCEVLK